MVFTGRAGLHKGFKQLKFGSKSDPKLAIFDNFQTVYFYDTPVCDGFLLPNYFEKMKDCKDQKSKRAEQHQTNQLNPVLDLRLLFLISHQLRLETFQNIHSSRNLLIVLLRLRFSLQLPNNLSLFRNFLLPS